MPQCRSAAVPQEGSLIDHTAHTQVHSNPTCCCQNFSTFNMFKKASTSLQKNQRSLPASNVANFPNSPNSPLLDLSIIPGRSTTVPQCRSAAVPQCRRRADHTAHTQPYLLMCCCQNFSTFNMLKRFPRTSLQKNQKHVRGIQAKKKSLRASYLVNSPNSPNSPSGLVEPASRLNLILICERQTKKRSLRASYVVNSPNSPNSPRRSVGPEGRLNLICERQASKKKCRSVRVMW